MLRKFRIILAAIVLCAVVLLFLRPWEESSLQLGFIAKLQFIPALLSLNVIILAVLIAVTLLFGRIYCSVICPLGIFQDIIGRLGRTGKKNKLRYTPSGEKKVRYVVWVLFAAALLAGISYAVILLDPYGLFGKMMATLGGKTAGWMVPAVSLVLMVVIGILAWKNGRTWCNTICPVGTTLGFFSKFSLFRPVIDKDKCKNCHVCERSCKAACIDIETKSIDYSRCVDCFDCVGACKFDALHYKVSIGQNKKSLAPGASGNADAAGADAGRRAFLSSAVMATMAATLGAQGKKLDGGLAAIIDKKAPERTVPLVPFGSESVKDFYKKCVACQLCISVCPNGVLKPSASLEHPMQPYMSYENGYCRPECTECSQVCPTGAILALTPEEKTQFHIGVASVDRGLCVVERDGVSCGNCARHCPVGAIKMVKLNPEDPDSPRIPAVDESRCIGCGACENLCPSRPFSAITVNGLNVHIKD